MRAVPRIKAAYDWAVEAFKSEAATAVANNDEKAIERLDDKRDVLERGMFVLLFAQFETALTECFENARDARMANPDWTQRRGWDVPSYSGTRVPFETKLAMVLDKQTASYKDVLRAYSLRNACAHGNTTEPVGSIDQFVNDLYTWQAQLRK